MSVLPGHPAELSARAVDLVSSAEVIRSVIRELRGIVSDDDEGQAVRALAEQNEQISAELERIQPRYKGTADAISEYAVALTTAHDDAHRAQDDLDEALLEQSRADRALEDLTDQANAADDPSPSLTGRVSGAQRDADDASAAVAAAERRIERAREDMDDAAETAIRRIDAAIDATNEGFWDGVGEFFSDIGDFLAGIGEWIGDFLEDVVNLLKAIADTLVAILATIAILLLIVAIGALFGTIGLIIGAVIAGVLAAFLIASVLSDVLKPTPAVSGTDPYAGDENKKPDDPSLATVLDGTTEVDKLGGETDTVVKITKVLGPDGWYYTVTLPSTQEWLSRFGDQGAVNDLDSNLALMLTPALQTQYERAVLDAMAQEGIGPDDPVMLVGFSQGGIMAGHLAAYNSDYNWQAVVVSGAPIDHMPIPNDVDVVSVQHNGDPVPRLDFLGGDVDSIEHGSNWTSIRVDPPTPNPTLGVDVEAHNSVDYSATLEDHIGEVQANHPDLGNFFNDNGYVDTSYYQWTE
ncbi:hypothetical protein JOD63_002182 [Microbacterium terrae]|uniref:Uncharacterized protein n=1 Tax=Microbacterium terrae TaxID=69369 RepID=A0A0M2HA79_9MICO|nr:hypothetical protein [Microbacterium terrae]KJL40925.1 hypothetical protein RS81_01469 [Microbacterium terrae]MBP1078214.1 hypothetical protein [Microbacterium terrae]GLJ97693.1 hypothetical protein GCM10017594_08900 [Microbacterium terrae]